jgi:hypothetical protein
MGLFGPLELRAMRMWEGLVVMVRYKAMYSVLPGYSYSDPCSDSISLATVRLESSA